MPLNFGITFEQPVSEFLQAPQLESRVVCFQKFETHIKDGKDYDTMSLRDVLDFERTYVAKDQSKLTLCSTYNKHDARDARMQEKHGRFVMIAIDQDKGSVQGSALADAVQSFTGPALMRVYASSSSTKEDRKWRVIIPTLTEMRHDEWHAVTVALNRHIEKATGHRPDRALEGANQGNYLPNTAPRTDGVAPLMDGTLIEAPLFDWRASPGADGVLMVMTEEEERRQEYEQRAIEARRKMSQMRARPDSDKTVIEQFNTANDLEQVLTACGYKQGPKGGWRSPNQSTDSFATKVFDEPAGQYWVSKSASDFAANVGSHARDGGSCFGDAFDVWCFDKHKNDRTAAIKAAAEELGIKPTPTQAGMLADMGRKLNTAKALQTLSGGPLAVAKKEEKAPALTEFDEGCEPPKDFKKPDFEAEPEQADQLLSFVQASNLPDWEPPHELIEGVLQEGVMSVVYGDSNTGKSFLALDMAAHISIGKQWFGREVKQGAVLYLAAESPKSIQNRSRALAQKLDVDLNNLFITDCPINVFDENGDTMAIVNTVKAIEKSFGVEIRLVIVDTLARAMGSGDENSTQDMGVLVQHSDMIRSHTKSHVMFIHHTGKDASRGARGSSALRAGTDTEIEVRDPGNQKPKEFEVTKQRDLEGKGEVYAFTLARVNLGLSNFGKLLTTCYVEQAQPAQSTPEDALTGIQREILDFIRDTPVGGLRFTELVKRCKEVRPTTADSTVSSNLKKMEKLGAIYYYMGQYRAGSGLPMSKREF